MNKQLKVLTTAFAAALLIMAVLTASVMAASGSGSSGDNEGNSVSGNSGSSAAADDKLKADVTIKDDRLKVEAKDGQNELKADVRVKEDKNKQTADVKVKNANSEIRVKAEAKTGFAGLFSRLMSSIFGKKQEKQAVKEPVQAPEEKELVVMTGAEAKPAEAPKEQAANKQKVITTAPGITIDKTLSQGPGYPTGPLDLSVPPTQLLLDKAGQVKGGEVKDRQYEVPLETIPPTSAAIPITINGAAYTASEVKVISNLKTKAGVGQHSGTIDVDIDVPLGSTLPAGHITLQYSGSAMVSGSMITSGGVFKTSKMTGVFAGLVSEGTYSMTIIESGQAFGSPAVVSITTTSSV